MKNLTNPNSLCPKLLITGLIFMISTSAFGQIILERTAVGSAGEEVEMDNLIIHYTIGEVAVLTHDTDGLQITEGFQQGDLLVTSIHNDLEVFEIEIYPNPTTDFLNIQIGELGNFKISLYDVTGRLIIEEKLILEDSSQWSIAHLAQGTYLLKIRSAQNNKSRSYKIQKF